MEPAASPTQTIILNELIAHEPIFHRWEHLQGRKPTRADFEQLTDPDFFEIGASGSLYARDFVLSSLETRHSDPNYRDDPHTTRDFRLRQLTPDTFLLTYTLMQHQPSGNRTTRRTTLWRQTAAGWKIRFHQGTLISPN